MRNPLKLIIICTLFFALVLIRVFESSLFYDPFISFYKSHYSLKILDDLNYTKLFGHTFLRYFLNTVISISILYIAFKAKDILKISIVFYSMAFIILIFAYIALATTLTKETYQLFFYVRRFLIQPIFILLLLPAFYYNRIKK